MKISNSRILGLWRKNPEWALSINDIRKALETKKQQNDQIKEILSALVTEGKLVKRRNGFLPPPQSGRSQPGKPDRQSGQGRKAPEASGRTDGRGKSSGKRSRSAEGVEGIIGYFSAHPNGFGFVDTPDLPAAGEAVMVPAKHIGGALDGDRVRLEMLPPRGSRRGTGRVVEVLNRQRATMRGTLFIEQGQWWLAPFNQKLPLIFLEDADQEEGLAEGNLVEVHITHFPTQHDEAPEGRIEKVYGEEGSAVAAVIDHILNDLGLSEDFSPEIRAEMQALQQEQKTLKAEKATRGDTTLPEAWKGREDQRHLSYVTIDGEDARDFDDAICLETLPGGKWRLWVAIADVAAYVVPGTAVDDGALQKSTSVYLPRRVLPMLPRLLSNELCSLKPKEPRLTLTCEVELDANGERSGYRIYESVIESKARLTYNGVQQWFETGIRGTIPNGLLEMLGNMRALAARLRQKRSERGALNFIFPEVKIDLNSKGEAKGLREVYPTEATRLIEQFMLEANETVAAHCEANGLKMLYRVHDAPPENKLHTLGRTLWNFNLAVKTEALSTAQGISELLERLEDHPQRELVELAVLKSMTQAQYRPINDGHFALAAEHYCHFTSPIRRYPDLIVHRALKASFHKNKRGLVMPPGSGTEHSNAERKASEAENRVKRLYTVLYMEPRLGEEFEATVNGVGENGLWLRLRAIPVDGLLPTAMLPGGGHTFDRTRGALVSRARGRTFSLGDQLIVRLVRADRLAQQLEFDFVQFSWKAE